MKRYFLLALVLGVAAIALSILGPPKSRGRTHDTRAQAVTPLQELTLVVRDSAIEPSLASVPKGTRVRLRIVNQGARPARIVLAGYEDHVPVPALSPGASWSGEFLADRPGEDFAWLLDGKPASRLAVTGSHLEEGHR